MPVFMSLWLIAFPFRGLFVKTINAFSVTWQKPVAEAIIRLLKWRSSLEAIV